MPRSNSNRAWDAVIVGGGVIGLACAWRAAQRGLGVCVLERGVPGSGATRVAAGMLAPVGEASWGEDVLLRANLASARAYPDFVAALQDASGLPAGYRPCGALHVALDRDEADELRRRHDLQRSLGLEAEWLLPAECRALEPGLATAVAGGVHAAHEAEVDPRSLTAALLAAATAAGASVVADAQVTDAVVESGRIRGARTADGRTWPAEQIVLAGGAWSGNATWLPEDARPPVRPVKGQILHLRGPARTPVCERIVATEWIYAVPRPGGRLVVGATVEERGFDVAVTAGGIHELLREGYRVLPEIAELEIAEAVAGLRPGTPDNAPLIGAGAIEGLVLATGHYRNGILLAPITAAAVVAVLAGEQPPPETAALTPARLSPAPEVSAR